MQGEKLLTPFVFAEKYKLMFTFFVVAKLVCYIQ